MKTRIAVLMMALGLATAAPAAAEVIAELDHLRDGELQSVGFELTKGGEIDIEAVGLRHARSRRMAVYAWIINSKTRDLVWSMTVGSTFRDGSRGVTRKAEKSEFFEPGPYELYMYAGDQWQSGIMISGGKDFYDILEDLLDRDDDDWEDWDERDWDRSLRDCYVRVSSDELEASDVRRFEVSGEIPNALASFIGLGDDEYVRQGFKIDEPMNVRIYALAEHPRGNRTPVDYGWIVNADTRERVWEMDRFNTERAGGGRKNRKFNDEVRFEKGNYILHYVTDDSHSWEEFNMEPPYDPINWGVTLLPGTDFKASAFHLSEVSDDRGKPLIDFTRARDDDYFEKAFELKKPATLSVYAIGECSDRDFVDYGWIEDALTGEIVWEMTYRTTEHAGGGEKNRMFDGSVELEAGKYVACYVTDGSHSYRDWNTGRPYDDKAYGMSIYPGDGFNDADFELLREDEVYEGTAVLARISGMRDHEREREYFSLDKDTQVRIHALGEGQGRRMYDYGWIENARTGRTVWEMTYRKTDHAGGASKNRQVTDTMTLPAGEYEVYYETDGSHSFGDWNASPPRHPRDWGITVSIAEEMARR